MRQIKAFIRTTFSLATLMVAIQSFAGAAHTQGKDYSSLADFGDNPGELTASYWSPSTAPKSLVVLLHGCVQDAQALAHDSGFSGLAKTHHFALLLPQQSDKNNIKQCFNWFSPQDTKRDAGETLSIKNMILTLKKKLAVDNVYIAGLSAGGAMTSSMLVNYPTLFNGGAVVAGLPYPCADSLIKAISCMRTGPSQSAVELAGLAQKTTPNNKQWPPLYVMTGNSDNVVNPLNSTRLAQQWALLKSNLIHKKTTSQGFNTQLWSDANAKPQIKLVEVNKMGHGISVNPAQENGGHEGAFIPKADISAAIDIVEFWQLASQQ